jgi:hypothetical protein
MADIHDRAVIATADVSSGVSTIGQRPMRAADATSFRARAYEILSRCREKWPSGQAPFKTRIGA